MEAARTVIAVLNPEGRGQQDEFTQKMRDDLGFVGAKRLSDGTYVGVSRLLYTLAICMGVSQHSAYQKRFCYDDLTSCLSSYERLSGMDDEPDGWIAKRPA